MNIQQMKINNIPSLVYGNDSEKVFIYVHGRYSSKEEASGFSQILTSKGYQVLSFDLPEHGERKNEEYPCNVKNGINDLQSIYESVRNRYGVISLFACSLGAYFSLVAYPNIQFQKCMFLSPVLNMQRLIEKMMTWANVNEKQLFDLREIKTNFEEVLSWDYYSFVKEHPVTVWKSPTYVLYGEKDNLTDRETLEEFSTRFNSKVKIMKDGEHYFHTTEQLSFLHSWIREQEYE